MDEITLKNVIIDHLITWLRQGYYVHYTDKYTGQYWDGANSNDRDKINKENIIFVNMPTVRTITGKDLRLEKLIFDVEIEGEKRRIPIWIIIDIDDWKIYMRM